VGPGLGQDDHADALLAAIFGFSKAARASMVGFHRKVDDGAETTQGEALISAEKLTVVDADALNWLAKHPDWFERVPAHSLVLTPHAGEMSRLLDRPTAEITADPAGIAAEAAARWRQTVVLK